MLDWLQIKYVNLLSNSLQNFKQVDSATWNFRCPLCGDSEKHKNKSRGYLLGANGSLRFYCHNCGINLRFKLFLEKVNYTLYQQFIVERFNQDQQEKKLFDVEKTIYETDKYLKLLPKVSQLDFDHLCKRYVVARQIPTTVHHKLFFCQKFKSWVNTIIPNKFDLSNSKDEDRLIIPLISSSGVLFGFQGRSFEKDDKVKYITIITNESFPHLYNCESVNFNETVFVFEGPINSMFIQNSISALGGSAAVSEVNKLDVDKSKIVFCFDNEPRNKQIIKNMLKATREQYKVVVWPDCYAAGDDINDIVLKREENREYCNTENVLEIGNQVKRTLLKNSYGGLDAELKIAGWKKC